MKLKNATPITPNEYYGTLAASMLKPPLHYFPLPTQNTKNALQSKSMKQFTWKADYAPAGDQGEAIRQLADGLKIHF